MEREKFEESWKNAFEGREITPSDNVWTNVELNLEKARGGELKRRLLFYKMLAAACVVFAMAVAGVGYYYSFSVNAPGTLANNEPSPADGSRSEDSFSRGGTAKDESSPMEINDGAGGREGLSNGVRESLSTREKTPAGSTDRHQPAHQNEHVRPRNTAGDGTTSNMLANGHAGERFAIGVEQPDYQAPNFTGEKIITPIYTRREVRLHFPKAEAAQVDPVVAMLANLERREKEVQTEEDREEKSALLDENLWTSIGFAAGSFNAIQSSSSSPMMQSTGNAAYAMAAAPIVDQETKASGYSYTMGVNVGTRLSGRWVLQGGVNYLTQASEYTANNVVMEPMGKLQEQRFRAASTNDLVNADETDLSNKLVYSAPYSVNNSMRYLSIPMQAGYLLVNKTFGLQLNAGVATDLFLQNTVKAEGNQLATTSQPSGEDSPYRAVNLSGLFGTEFSYRFGPHYRISLNPGLRYPFNTIYKSELGVQSTPLTFDVGLRFRYIFH